MADVLKGEMIRGQIDTVILLALTDGDKDSNDIRVAIEEKSDNQYSIKQGTFYSAMQRLVKQGLIKEYRSSALDGIRRKYYSLTPKGTKYLDKNREQWSISKALVDNLIDAEPTQPEVTAEKPVEPTIDEFDTFKALVDQANDNFTLETEEPEDSYFDVLGASVLDDLNSELKKLETESVENTVIEEQPLTQVENEKVEIIEDKSSDFVEDYSSLSNKTKEELFSFELDEDEFENIATEEEMASEEQFLQEDSPANDEEFINEEIIVEETTSKEVYEEKAPEEDDLLIVEEYTPSNRNKYKQILNSILPKEPKKEESQEIVEEKSQFEQVNFESYQTGDVKSYEEDEERRARQLEKLRSETAEKHTEEKVERKHVNNDPSDFSDLYAMANREGFKIRTSHNTNKFAGSGILINKLRMNSALLFFILLFAEALVLNFALSSILQWKAEIKLIILGCLAIFPIITAFIYWLSPKRLVDEVSQFKDAMGVALIITFQMAIIILCVALFASVDFNNFKEVSSYILLPFVLALNVPIYFILKYSLLSTGKYFSE